jgi:hypothetical protein
VHLAFAGLKLGECGCAHGSALPTAGTESAAELYTERCVRQNPSHCGAKETGSFGALVDLMAYTNIVEEKHSTVR